MTAATGGCSSKSSSDGGEGGTPIATRDMHITATVHAADESTAAVSVSLHDDQVVLRTEYSLTGGDRLNACVNAACKRLEHDSSLPLTGDGYETALTYVAETPYTISFSRPTGVGAPNSSVTLPVSFAILAPPAGLGVTDGDSVTVQWSPAGVDETVNVTSDEVRCTHEDGALTDWFGSRLATNVDTGAATVAVDELLESLPHFAETQSPVRRCDLVLEVAHERRGTPDPAFAGGRVIGRVSRSVTIEYVPRP